MNPLGPILHVPTSGGSPGGRQSRSRGDRQPDVRHPARPRGRDHRGPPPAGHRLVDRDPGRRWVPSRGHAARWLPPARAPRSTRGVGDGRLGGDPPRAGTGARWWRDPRAVRPPGRPPGARDLACRDGTDLATAGGRGPGRFGDRVRRRAVRGRGPRPGGSRDQAHRDHRDHRHRAGRGHGLGRPVDRRDGPRRGAGRRHVRRRLDGGLCGGWRDGYRARARPRHGGGAVPPPGSTIPGGIADEATDEQAEAAAEVHATAVRALARYADPGRGRRRRV